MKETVRKELYKILKRYNCNSIDKMEKNDWLFASMFCSLSEDFIKEFKDNVDWDWIWQKQHLSEDFILEFLDKADECSWRYISYVQNLSFDFILDFDDKIVFDCLAQKENFSIEEFKKYKERKRIHSRFEILDL